MQVLIVDDSSLVRKSLARIIDELGHIAFTVASGKEAIDYCMKQEPDLMLIDVEMPGLSGIETTHRVRTLSCGKWFPIIFLSGNMKPDTYYKAIEAGGDDYITKPIDSIIIKAKLLAMSRIAEMRRELKLANEKLHDLAHHDHLTGITNRLGFVERFDMEWQRAKREKKPLSIIMLDIDHFKQFNDHYGHGAGDDCLAKVAGAMEKKIQPLGNCLARYGGEEFVVTLADTEVEEAVKVSEELLDVVRSLNIKHEYSSAANVVTISVGIATQNQDEAFDNAQTLLKAADDKLYQAKELGRNQCQF